MSGLGVLDAIRPDEKTGSAVRPGATAPTLATQTNTSRTVEEHVADSMNAFIESTISEIERRVERNRTSTTLAELALTYAACADRVEDSIPVAIEALQLSVSESVVVDRYSAKLVSDALIRLGESEVVYNTLKDLVLGPALSFTFASAAAAIGRPADAKIAIEKIEDPIAEAFRGYLAARERRWSDAVRHLRTALKDEPNDVDSLLNLSVSLYGLGSLEKATRTALQATRVSPGRKDVSIHYLELLLARDDTARFYAEEAMLKAAGVIEDAALLALRGRALLLDGKRPKAIAVLTRAANVAEAEGDTMLQAEVLSNLANIKRVAGTITWDAAFNELKALVEAHPDSDSAIVNYAALARRRSDAEPIRAALLDMVDLAPAYAAFLRHQLATLEGDAATAAEAASDWFRIERHNPDAAAAAIVSVGIGAERWDEAALIADLAVPQFPRNKAVVNNSAYVWAMAGRADDAIRAIETLPDHEEDYVLKATLGLAHLAKRDIATGTRLYREAADEAEKVDPSIRSLMTAYQAMVIRQLGLAGEVPRRQMEAQLLIPADLPEDWQDQPDFVRIHNLFEARGYSWPPSPEF